MTDSSRRDLLRLASLATVGAGLAEAASPQARSVAGMKFEKKDKVSLGVIGVGGWGNVLIDNFTAGRVQCKRRRSNSRSQPSLEIIYD